MRTIFRAGDFDGERKGYATSTSVESTGLNRSSGGTTIKHSGFGRYSGTADYDGTTKSEWRFIANHRSMVAFGSKAGIGLSVRQLNRQIVQAIPRATVKRTVAFADRQGEWSFFE